MLATVIERHRGLADPHFTTLSCLFLVVVEKRKLLDSRMLAVHGSAWTEWNVRTAVKVWRDSGRNFGLAVEVEDEDGTRLDAHQFFNGMNCTQEACECPANTPSATP